MNVNIILGHLSSLTPSFVHLENFFIVHYSFFVLLCVHVAAEKKNVQYTIVHNYCRYQGSSGSSYAYMYMYMYTQTPSCACT